MHGGFRGRYPCHESSTKVRCALVVVLRGTRVSSPKSSKMLQSILTSSSKKHFQRTLVCIQQSIYVSQRHIAGMVSGVRQLLLPHSKTPATEDCSTRDLARDARARDLAIKPENLSRSQKNKTNPSEKKNGKLYCSLEQRNVTGRIRNEHSS